MRLTAFAVALVAALQCFCLGVHADDGPPPLADVALKKLVEESVGTPVAEFWKDLYEALVRKKGSQFLRKLRYKTAGKLSKDQALELARVLMDKLKKDIFAGRVNKQIWDALTMELYFLLLEWWSTTPENPKDAAEVGAWHALVKMYKEILAPTMRGSNRVAAMNEILLDPDLEIIRKWVADWRGDSPAPAKSQAAPAAKEAQEKKDE
ncbi:hypothetical protein Efla_003618 [Eimeria flavescens]